VRNFIVFFLTLNHEKEYENIAFQTTLFRKHLAMFLTYHCSDLYPSTSRKYKVVSYIV